jgi:hypothetical protein
VHVGITEQFAGTFGGSIGRHGQTDVIVLGKGDALPRAIHGGRRAKEQLSDVVRTAAFQQVERPLDVDFTIQQGSFDRRTHTRHGGKMDHQIDRLFLEEALEQCLVTNVPLSAYHAPGGPRHGQQALHMLLFDCRGIKIIEIIQARYSMALSP